MATTTLTPNGDGTINAAYKTESNGTSNLYATIDEGTTTPNDSDYVKCEGQHVNAFFTLTDTPSDLATVTACDIKIRTGTGKIGDYYVWDTAQIVGSDETTALTSSISIGNNNGNTTPATFTVSPSVSVTDKTSWDGARLKVRTSTGSTNSAKLYAVQVDLTYTASSGTTYNETGSGGAYCWGTHSTNSLVTDLVAHWQLNETSGTRYDIHSTNDLTDNNTVGYTTGKLDNAATFVSSAGESLTIADNTKINFASSDWSLSFWFKLDSLTNNAANDYLGVISKGSGGSTYAFSVNVRPSNSNQIQVQFYNNPTTYTLWASTYGSLTTGVWYHVIVTYKTSNKATTISVNGTENTGTASIAVVDSGYTFAIGRGYNNNTYNFSGSVDSVSLWKKVLTSQEKINLYRLGNGYDYEFANYNYGSVISGGATAGGIALNQMVNSDTASGGAIAGGESTLNGLTNLTASGGVIGGGVAEAGKVYSDTATGGATLGGSYSQSTLMSELVAHWPLNETSGVRYDAHWDNDLTDNNTVSYTTGKLGNAATFVSSANEWLSTTDNEHINLDGETFTVAAWVKFNALTNNQSEDWVGFIGKGDDFGLNQFAFSIAYRPSLQRLQFGFADNAGQSSSITANAFGAISTGVWYFVMVSYNSANQAVTISVNGSENSGTSPYVIYDNEYPLNLGRMMANRYNFSGKVDSVSLWKRVLTTAEKTQMYNSGVGWDYVFDYETEDVSTSGGVVLGGTNAAVKVIVPTTSGGVIGNGGSKKNYICGSCCPSSLAHDTFWDDDEATLLSHESSNGFWSANLNLQIYSERVLGFSEDQQFATLDVGQDDYTINQIVAGVNGKVAIVFRYFNTSNHWRFVWEPENECVRLLEVTGGLETQKGFALVTTTIEVDYLMNVLSYGDEIICSFNGTEVTTTSSTFNTMTNVGFMIDDMGCEVAEWCCQTPVHNVLTSGGAFVGGTAIDNVDINQATSGGVLCDGVSDSDPYFYNEGDGGALAGGTAVVGHGLAASGGALAGGLATVTNRWNHLGIGGGVVNGSNSTVYNITGSGGVICQSAGYSTGLQFRKLLTIAPLYSLENFPFMFKLNVQTGLTISEIKATTSGGTALPAEYISYTDGKLCGMVRTNIDATLDTEVYIYYGGN